MLRQKPIKQNKRKFFRISAELGLERGKGEQYQTVVCAGQRDLGVRAERAGSGLDNKICVGKKNKSAVVLKNFNSRIHNCKEYRETQYSHIKSSLIKKLLKRRKHTKNTKMTELKIFKARQHNPPLTPSSSKIKKSFNPKSAKKKRYNPKPTSPPSIQNQSLSHHNFADPNPYPYFDSFRNKSKASPILKKESEKYFNKKNNNNLRQKSSLGILKKRFSLINNLKTKNRRILPDKIIRKMTKLLSDDFEKIERDIYSKSLVEKKSILNEIDKKIRSSLSKVRTVKFLERSPRLKSFKEIKIKSIYSRTSLLDESSRKNIPPTLQKISKNSLQSHYSNNSDNMLSVKNEQMTPNKLPSLISRKSHVNFSRKNKNKKMILQKFYMRTQGLLESSQEKRASRENLNCSLRADNKTIESNFNHAKNLLKNRSYENKFRDQSRDKPIYALKKESDLNKSAHSHSSKSSSKFQNLLKNKLISSQINQINQNSFSKSLPKPKQAKTTKSSSQPNKLNHIKLKKLETIQSPNPSRRYILKRVNRNGHRMDSTIKSLSKINKLNQTDSLNESIFGLSVAKNASEKVIDFKRYLSNKKKIKDKQSQEDHTRYSSFTLPTQSVCDVSLMNQTQVIKDLNQIMSTKKIISKINHSDNFSQKFPYSSHKSPQADKNNVFKMSPTENFHQIFSNTISSYPQHLYDSTLEQRNDLPCMGSWTQSNFGYKRCESFQLNENIFLKSNQIGFDKALDVRGYAQGAAKQEVGVKPSKRMGDGLKENKEYWTKNKPLRFQVVDCKKVYNSGLKQKLFNRKQKLKKINQIKLIKLQKIASNNIVYKRKEHLCSKTKKFDSNFSIKTQKLDKIFQKEQKKVLNDLISFIESPK
jgi:hypothetical protein